MRVDLPAPFGPSRPRISPLDTANDKRETARRRPKWRETAVSSTRAKSTLTRRGLRGLQARGWCRRCRARRKPVRGPAAAAPAAQCSAPRLLDADDDRFPDDELLKELLATGDQALSLGAARGLVGRA